MSIPRIRSIRQATADVTYVLGTLIVSFTLSWLVLAMCNFSYGVWHDWGGIGAAIDEYGAKNRFKKGFHLTTKAQRSALFSQINKAIHNGGEGLSDITYKVEGLPEQTLLRTPEVIHLQDVANLVSIGFWVAVIGTFMWGVCLGFYWFGLVRPPNSKQLMVVLGGLFGLIGLLLLVIGPKEFFYWMHEFAFPDGHQWFFYYQESLMSTMMYAPLLFGYIAIEWCLLALGCLVGFHMLARWVYRPDLLT